MIECPPNWNLTVGEGGLEPPRPFEHWHLKPARLPFRHSPEWMLHASNWGSTPQPIRDICSGIVLVMSATDWESRELHDASRERLLTEIGMIRQTYETEISVIRQAFETSRMGELDHQIRELESQIVEIKHELLAARDFAMGALAEAGEQHAQVFAQSAQLAAAQERIAFLSKHINRMRNSTTWKLGRIAMLPVRIAKRILRRSS